MLFNGLVSTVMSNGRVSTLFFNGRVFNGVVQWSGFDGVVQWSGAFLFSLRGARRSEFRLPKKSLGESMAPPKRADMRGARREELYLCFVFLLFFFFRFLSLFSPEREVVFRFPFFGAVLSFFSCYYSE